MPVRIIVEDPGKHFDKDKTVVELVVGDNVICRLNFGEIAEFEAPAKPSRTYLKVRSGSSIRRSNIVRLGPANEYTVHLVARYNRFWRSFRLLLG